MIIEVFDRHRKEYVTVNMENVTHITGNNSIANIYLINNGVLVSGSSYSEVRQLIDMKLEDHADG